MTIRINGADLHRGRTEFLPICAEVHPGLLYRSREAIPFPQKKAQGKGRGRKLDIMCIVLNAACTALSLLILGWLMR